MPRLRLSSPAQVAFTVLSALSVMVVVGCSGATSRGDSTAATSKPPATATTSPLVEQLGTDLIAHPASSFAVTFKWENPARHEQGFLVWRQGNGVRRWDLVQTEDGKAARGGSITFETDFSTSGALGSHSLGCLWVAGPSAPITRNAPPGQAFASCSGGGNVIFKPIHDTLLSRLGTLLRDPTIAGRRASCYSLDDWRFTAATLCVDASHGIPLLIMTEYDPNYGDSRFSQSMEAISVSTAEQDVPVPLGLDPDAPNPSYEGMAALSDLGLPDLPELEE
jgi:hypothetical protein